MSRVCSEFLKRWTDARINQQDFVSKNTECLDQESLYTLKLLQKHLKPSWKCHALQIYVGVENVENLSVGLFVFVCVCVCVCVCVWFSSMHCWFAS